MAELVRARLRVANDGDRVTVSFTRGSAEVLLRFPVAEEERVQAGTDLAVLTDNIIELIDAANLEIEAAILRQEEMPSE